jgi:hypothetical protein
MLKSSFAVVIIMSCGFAFAEENPRAAAADSEGSVAERKSSTSLPAPARRSARLQASATPLPAATPAPRSFFQRLFGRRTKPTAQRVAPATTPQPVAPRPRRPRSGTTVGRQEATSEETETSKKKAEPKAASEKPESADGQVKDTGAKPDEGTATETSAPPKQKSGKGSRATAKRATPPPDLTTPEAQEKWKYDEARTKASEDQEVRTLKEKADASPNEDEGRRALRAYNKALFDKMRRIDPTIKERIDAMEAGVMKRLGE